MERDRVLQQQLQEEAERMEKQREKEVCIFVYVSDVTHFHCVLTVVFTCNFID